MKQFTSQEIQSQFEKLPKELQDAVTSTDALKKAEDIGKKHDLLLDQTGALVDEIGLVMLGLVKSPEFVDRVAERLGIPRQDAFEIARDVNSLIFNQVRTYLQDLEEARRKPSEEPDTHRNADLSILEKVGGITVDETPEAPEEPLPAPADKDKILSDLENPTPAPQTSMPKTPEIKAEPLVDHLLTSPTAEPQETVSVTPPATPTPPQPKGPQKPDQYRELI